MASQGESFEVVDHDVIGWFSTDEEARYCDDRRNRRFFVEPDNYDHPNFDLMQGFDEFVPCEAHDVQLPSSASPIMEWMRYHRQKLIKRDILVSRGGGESKRLNVDFVARRGVLCRLLRAASSLEKVDILVTLCNGTYYIERLTANQDPGSEMCFKGANFIRYVASVDGRPPDVAQLEPLHANACYYAVTRARCGAHRMMFFSDTQAERRDSKERPPNNLVSIKTNWPIVDEDEGRQESFKRNKTLAWWSQTHLAGIPEVLCGFRDDSRHIISSIELMKTEELPGTSRPFWTAKECQEKFNALLDDIKMKIQDDDPKAVYHLELEKVEKSRGAKERLRTRMFTNHGRKGDDYVIVKDWYLRDVLDIKE